MHRRDEVAIKRAEMAREMAELELGKVKKEREDRENEAKRYREECRRLKRDVEEQKERERKLVKRLAAQEVWFFGPSSLYEQALTLNRTSSNAHPIHKNTRRPCWRRRSASYAKKPTRPSRL